MQIVGQAVIFDNPSVFKLIEAHDRKIAIIFQFRPMRDLVVLLVSITFVLEHFWRYAQSNPSVDTPASSSTRDVLCALGVFLEGGDVVPKKAGCLTSCMRDERLCLRKF